MKPSILMVGNFLSGVGRNRTMIEELALRLEKAGYSPITTSMKRSRPLRLLDILFTAFARRANYRVACVSVFSGPAFIWAELVCGLLWILRKPYILTLHGGNLPSFARRWPGRVRRLFKGADAVTAPSRYLHEAMRIYREDILLIPNPLEVTDYPFRLRSNCSPQLSWLRAFHNIYNPQLAPLVISELRAFFPDLRLTMIGPDKGDGALQATQAVIEDLGLQKWIQIVPGISKCKVPAYLGSSDIFINTTNVDNTPVSVLEAMACGCCIVTTDVGGIPYLLEDGIDALLVPSNNPSAMAAAVKRIIDEPALAVRLSSNARAKVEQFDWSIILPQWERLFDRVTSYPI